MGLIANVLNSIFGKKRTDKSAKQFNYLDLFTPFFSGDSRPEVNTTYVAAVSTHARHISKAQPYVKYING